jgi:hypothetical protein
VNDEAVEVTPTLDCKTWVEGVNVCADENPVVNKQSIVTSDAFKRPNAGNPTKQ